MLAIGAPPRETHPTGTGLQLGSTTFANNTFMPISTIHNLVMNNVNVCSIDGSPGGKSVAGTFLERGGAEHSYLRRYRL